RHAANELVGHALGDELGVDLRLADLDDVQLDLALGHRRQLRAQLLDVGALLADDHAGARGIDRDAAQLGRTLDHHLRDRRLRQVLDDVLAQLDVFLEQLAVVAPLGVPAAVPGPVDLQPEADRIRFLTHRSGLLDFANDDAQPAERLENARGLATAARRETLHGDGLADRGLAHD